MSMGVGDSQDLIHGGGGSLRVFWLSRTDLEKKLLVAVCVLSLTVIGLLVGVGVLATKTAALSGTDASVEAVPTHSKAHMPSPAIRQLSTSTIQQSTLHHQSTFHTNTIHKVKE